MNKIIYFSRNKKAGFSIQKVFKTIIEHPNNIECKVEEVPFFRANLKSIFKNLKFVYSKKDKTKIHHITGDIHYCVLALIGVKTVLTIHDLALLKQTNNPFKKTLYYLIWYYLPIKLATSVTCISEQTKKEVQRYVKRKDITVITNPVAKEFIKEIKGFNYNLPVILHIGTGWNKNLNNVIKSLKDIKCHLRIIGKLKQNDLELLESLKVDFSNSYGITDEEILEEYKKADIISFPSIFEGFGMPIIEGQAIGRVVLTSNISPMKEIGNKSVIKVNPNSVTSIRKGFIKLLEDNEYREYLVNEGFENVKKHSAFEVVQQYKNLYYKTSKKV